MVMLTVIGEGQIEAGYVFVYLGPLSECKECRVKNICFNLDKGKRYRVVGSRKMKHDCKVHEGGVQVVEVEEVPWEACVPDKGLVEGSAATLSPAECRRVGCPHYRLCIPIGVEKGIKVHILELGEKVECAQKESRRKVKVS
jgi:uncharacterized protein (UPF0179 family)